MDGLHYFNLVKMIINKFIIQQVNIYIYLASVFGFISVVLSLLSKINDDDIDKTHIYDSLAIDIQLVLKAIGLCTFLVGIVKYRLTHWKNKGLMKYVLYLGIYGIFCYCSSPVIILN